MNSPFQITTWCVLGLLATGCAEEADKRLGSERARALDAMVPDGADPLPGADAGRGLADGGVMEAPDTGAMDAALAEPDADPMTPDADPMGPDAAPMPPDADVAEPDADVAEPDAELMDPPDAAPGQPELDPSAPGPYAVGVEEGVEFEVSDGTDTLIVCAPEEAGERAEGEFPVVIISPGFQLGLSQYRSYCEHFASWGYFTVIRELGASAFGIDHPALGEDLAAFVDALTAGDSPYAAHLDPGRVALAGHSLGGKLSFLAAADLAATGGAVEAVIGFDPVDMDPPAGFGVGVSVVPERGADLTMPVLVLGETLDADPVFALGPACAPAEENYTQYYDAASDAAVEVTVLDADHIDWVDDPNCGLACSICQPGTADAAEVGALSRRTALAFLRLHLEGDASMAWWVDGPGIQGDGRVEVRSR